MITVRYGNPEGLVKEECCIFVSFPYSASIVQVMRSFYVRRWHPNEKYWELPYDTLPELQRLLPNEQFEIHGNPPVKKETKESDLDLDISLPTCRTTPYEYQQKVYAKAMNFNKYILNLEMGTGKAQPLYSKVLTPNGFITMGRVQVGMSVLGEDGLPHKVLGVYPQGKKRVYELIFSDGSKCRCSDEHLWTFWRRNNPKKSLTKTLREFLSTSLYSLGYHKKDGKRYKNYNYFLPKISPMCFSDIKLPLDPWLLGLILGDGCLVSNGCFISIYEYDILEKVETLISKYGCKIGSGANKNGLGDLNIVRDNCVKNTIITELSKLGLMGHKSSDKFIPQMYLGASVPDRLALLQGLYDADGCTGKNQFTYSTSSRQLAQDIVYLVRSLGGTCSCNEHEAFYTYKGEKKQGLNNFELYIKLPNGMLPYSSDKHKVAHCQKANTTTYRSLRAVNYIGEEECQCIYIDSPTHLYITDDFIPTHNTMLSLMIMKKRMEQNVIKRCLIIPCVASLKYNWQEEIRTHLGENSLVLGNRRNTKGRWVVKGTQEKLEDLSKLKPCDKWIITNVESFRNTDIKKKIKKLVQKGEIDALIIDEVHKLVSPQAQQTKAILSIATGINYTLCLTGTILLNRPTDLFVPLKLIDAEPKTFTAFKNFYCIMGGYGGYQVVGYKNLDELQYRLSNVSVRVRKDDVLDLPDKVFADEYLEMGKKQSSIYSQVLDAIMSDIDKVVLMPNPLSEMIRLRQATADTSILSESINESVKFDRAESLISDIVAGGNSVLVFSNWATVIDNLNNKLSKSFKVAKITGQTKDVMAQKDKFNEDDCNILLMTTKAGGTGHTFNKASYVIFLDEPWTAADLQQAVARCHRIGQTKSVTIYTLMCKDTIDEYIHKIVKRKAALGDSLVDAKYNLKNKDVINYLLTGEGSLE